MANKAETEREQKLKDPIEGQHNEYMESAMALMGDGISGFLFLEGFRGFLSMTQAIFITNEDNILELDQRLSKLEDEIKEK